MTTEKLPVTEQIKKHNDREHMTLGGSSADRWMNCPGSIFLSKDLPKAPAGERAIRGTAAHELAEKAIRSFLQKKITGEGIPGVSQAVLEFEDEEAAEWVLRYCELIWTRVLNEYITGKAYGVEEMMVLHEGMEMGGTGDLWVIYKDNRARRVLCIVDFKTGRKEVDITGAQFPFYACCFREELISVGKDIDIARCIVIQPPLGQDIDPETGDPADYKEITYTQKQLENWRKKFIKAGEVIFLQKKPKFKTGAHCTWCPAQGACPKYQKELAIGSQLEAIKAEDVTLPDAEMIPDDQLVKIVLNKKKIEAFLKSCNKVAISKQLSGQRLPGLKAVQGVGRRTWLDDEQIVHENLVNLGLDSDELYVQKLKGIGKIETMLKELGHKPKELKKLLEPVTDKPLGAVTLVSIDDPREEISGVGGLLGDESDTETDEE